MPRWRNPVLSFVAYVAAPVRLGASNHNHLNPPLRRARSTRLTLTLLQSLRRPRRPHPPSNVSAFTALSTIFCARLHVKVEVGARAEWEEIWWVAWGGVWGVGWRAFYSAALRG